MASSATGQYLAAGDDGGDIWLSSDYGATWTEQTPAGSRSWKFITSSSDGQEIAAVDNAGYIWTTLDHGAHWQSASTTPGTGGWTSITMSADGQYLAAADQTNNKIWVSADYGADWTEAEPASDTWASIAYSPDGNTLAAGSQISGGTGYIAVSTDHGAHWTTGLGPGPETWYSITAANGGKLAAAGRSTDIWTSTDNGAHWHDTGFGSDLDFASVNVLASSYDGSVLVAVSVPGPTGGHIFLSTDSGADWTAQTSVGNNQSWDAIASNSDGSRLAAAGYESRDIWTYLKPTPPSPPAPAPTPSPTPSGGGGMIVGSGPLAPSAAGLSGYTAPRPQIDYPNGTVVYLDATSSASTTSPLLPQSTATTTSTPSTPITTPQSPTPPTSSSPFLINRQLWDEGPDILALQQWLNTHGFPLASTGWGSPGNETDTPSGFTPTQRSSNSNLPTICRQPDSLVL